MSILPQPQPQPDPHPDQAFPLPAWLGLNRRWSQVQADTQELQMECCLMRAMEIQSHGLLKKENQTVRYFKGVSATAYAQKPAGNLTEHPERRHVPREQGLPGWEARAVGIAHGEGKGKENLPACLSQPRRSRIFELLPDDKGNSSHIKMLHRTCPIASSLATGTAGRRGTHPTPVCKQHSGPCPGSCLCLQPGLKPFCTMVCLSAPCPGHCLPLLYTPWRVSGSKSQSLQVSGCRAGLWSHMSPALTIPCPCQGHAPFSPKQGRLQPLGYVRQVT